MLVMASVLHKPNGHTWIIILCNFVILLGAVFVPLYHQWITAQLRIVGLWRIDNTQELILDQATFVSAIWLMAANLSSIISLILVNNDASEERGRFREDERLPANCSILAIRADKKLKAVWGLTWGTVIFLVLVVFVLLFQGPTHRVVAFANVASGGIYMFVVFVTDLIGHSAISDCQKIEGAVAGEISQMGDGPDKDRKKRFLNVVRNSLTSLSFFTKVAFLVDIPILLGLLIIYLQEFGVMQDSWFRIGFATGAVAMHIIAANLVSIMLSIFIFSEAHTD
jgi:hypothetical protein